MSDDLVERLNDESMRLSGQSIDRGCVDSGIASNLADRAAARIEALEAERYQLIADLADMKGRALKAESRADAAESALTRLQDNVCASFDKWSKALGWGLIGVQPECWALMDAAVKELVSKRSALAEAVEERDRLRDDIRHLWNYGTDDIRICEHCDAWMTIEEAARVDDVSLCPREAYGSVKFPDEKCFKHRAWVVKEERKSASAFVQQHEGKK